MPEDQSPSGIAAFFGLVLLHALLAAAFSSLVNARKQHLRESAEAGNRQAIRAFALADDATRLLALRQFIYMLLHFAAAAVALVTGQTIAVQSGAQEAAAVFITLATLLVGALIMLLFGELIPSGLGSLRADKVAMSFAGPMSVLIRLLAPFSTLMLWVSNRVTSSVGGRSNMPYITEEEIMTLVDAGQEEGVIEDEEKEMIFSIFQFNDKVVREVMIPRIDMVALNADATLDEALKVIISEGHSRIPVYEGTVDKIIGLLYAKDMLNIREDQAFRTRKIREILRAAYFVPESKRASELLEELQRRKVHMAIVIDEYGGTAGLVTIEDLLEEIVGEIQDEYDPDEEAESQQISENEYRFDAGISLADVNELLHAELATDESDTLGGYIFTVLGKVPQIGETFESDGLRFTVESLDGRRIEWVRIERLKREKSEEKPSEPSEKSPDEHPQAETKRTTRASPVLPTQGNG